MVDPDYFSKLPYYSLKDDTNKSLNSSTNQKVDSLRNEVMKCKSEYENIQSKLEDLRLDNSKRIRKELKNHYQTLNQLSTKLKDLDEKSISSDQKQLCLEAQEQVKAIANDVLELLSFKRKERHEAYLAHMKRDSHGMIDDSINEAFKEGNEQPVKHYIKLGKEKIVSREVTKETHQLSNVVIQNAINLLATDYENTTLKFIQKPNDHNLWIQISNPTTSIEFSQEMWNEVDFETINITPEQLTKYEQMLVNKKFYLQPKVTKFLIFDRFPSKEDFKKSEAQIGIDGSKIDYSHKLAINLYTGEGYAMINLFMQGLWENLSNVTDRKLTNEAAAKESLFHSLVIAHGLYKLDNYEGKERIYLFRGENYGFKSRGTLNKRKEQIDQEGVLLIKNNSFMSSSYEKPYKEFFTEKSSAGLLLKQGGGKDVTAWSYYEKKEREVLLPPMMLKWESYKDIMLSTGQKVTLFLVKPSL